MIDSARRRATPIGNAAPEHTLFLQLAVSAPIMGIASLMTGEPPPQLTQALAPA